jgi:hypothetical protein
VKRALLLLPSLACFATAALIAPVSAAEGPGSGFFGFTLTGSSQALQLTEDEPSANSHPESEVDVPHSEVSLTSGPVGYALSSVTWPGALVGNAGSLVLLVRPDAPQQVTVLNDPIRAEARSGSATSSSTNDDVPGTHLEANATPALTQAKALTNGGAAGTTVGFGETTSSTVATLGTATAKVTADSTAKDLSLAAGAVKIGSVVSHAEGTTDGVTASAAGRTTVGDLTIGGVPVTVDQDGVHVMGQGGQVDPVAVATVNGVLANLNMTIGLSAATESKTGGTVSHDAGSLTFFWLPPGSANTFTASFGGARVLVGATRSATTVQPSSPPTDLDSTTGTQPVTTTGGGGTGAGTSGSPIGPDSSTGATAPVTDGTTGSVPPPVVQDRPQTVALAPLARTQGTPAWSVLLVVLGGLLALGGLWRVPGLVLVGPRPLKCPLEEET